jgi:hypothetical protein
MNDGTSAQTAWQSISKLQKLINILQPGDSILFRCNDTIVGGLMETRSGTSSKPLYFGSYETGNKPIITGKTVVSNWTQSSANIWNANCTNCIGSVTNFFINERPQQIGRWPNVTEPNKGYLKYNAHIGLHGIVDSTLSDSINWTGAEAVVRRNRWILDRLPITSQIKDSLLFNQDVSYSFIDGFGYFIQNDRRTLDQQGEWYFNPANKQFSIFSQINPNSFNTKTTFCDTLLNMNNVSNVNIENIVFDGAGIVAINVYNCSTIKFNSIDITNSGTNAVVMNISSAVNFENNSINSTNNNGITLWNCTHFNMQNNLIINTALVAGMGLGADNQYFSANLSGNSMTIENNRIDSAGYIALAFNGDSILIKNNVVSNYCMTKDDGGGIYTWSSGSPINYARKVIENIVYNAIGAPEGSGWVEPATEGLYMDDRTPNVDLIGNTIFNCGNDGIVIHNANHIHVSGNTIYNCGSQIAMGHDSIAPTFPINGCLIDSNIFVAKFAKQKVGYFHTIDNGMAVLGSFDHNAYCQPLGDSMLFNSNYFNGVNVNETLSLESWKAEYNQDIHSTVSPINITPYIVNSVTSSNYINNGSFTGNASGWYSWANYANGAMSYAANSGVSGGAMHAAFSSMSGKTDGYMDIISNDMACTTDKTYRLQFAAKSNKTKTTLQVIPKKDGNPYNNVADTKSFVIDSVYKTYEYIFTPNVDEPKSRIDFQMTEGQGDIWLDNISLVEVDVTKTNPDDYIFFDYNPTKNDKTIDLNDSYIDVYGNPVASTILLKPFTSVILFKNINHISKTKSISTLNAITLRPNPATNFINIKSNEEIQSVNIYTMNGILVMHFDYGNSTEYTIPLLPNSGLYTVQIVTKNNIYTKKLIIVK